MLCKKRSVTSLWCSSKYRGHRSLLFVSYTRQSVICLVFFREIRAKAGVDFLSVSLNKRQIAIEASAAVSYHETVKNTVSRVKRQILGCLGHVSLVHRGRRPLFAERVIDCCICEATAIWFCGSSLFLYRSWMNKTHNLVRKQVWVKSQKRVIFQGLSLGRGDCCMVFWLNFVPITQQNERNT